MICNFCPVTRTGYRLGLPKPGEYQVVFNSDDAAYGGTGMALADVVAEKEPMHGLSYSGEFTIPPLSTTFYRRKVTPRKHKKED